MSIIKRAAAWWGETLDQIVIGVMRQDNYRDVAQLIELLVAIGHTESYIYVRFRRAGAAVIWAWYIRRYASLVRLGKHRLDTRCHECRTPIQPAAPKLKVREPYNGAVLFYCQKCATELLAANGLTPADVAGDWQSKQL